MKKFIIHALLAILLVTIIGCDSKQEETLPEIGRAEFTKLLQHEKIDTVHIIENESGIQKITGTQKMGEAPKRFSVNIDDVDSSITKAISKHGVALTVTHDGSNINTGLISWIPLFVYIFIISIIGYGFSLAIRLVRAVEKIAENTKNKN